MFFWKRFIKFFPTKFSAPGNSASCTAESTVRKVSTSPSKLLTRWGFSTRKRASCGMKFTFWRCACSFKGRVDNKHLSNPISYLMCLSYPCTVFLEAVKRLELLFSVQYSLFLRVAVAKQLCQLGSFSAWISGMFHEDGNGSYNGQNVVLET